MPQISDKVSKKHGEIHIPNKTIGQDNSDKTDDKPTGLATR